MRGISELKRGRRLQTGAKRIRLRRRQPRYAGNRLKSDFKQAPRVPKPQQPYLSTSIKIEDLL